MHRSLVALLFLSPLVAAMERPNFVVIYTDDHGWPDLGAAQIHPDLQTPHLDALAADGVRCTSGYSTAPQCVPSRAGLLTGRAQNRFGVEANGAPLEGFNKEPTIAERLKISGYATGQIGKWHLGPASEITTHGFADVFAKNGNQPGWANYNLVGETTPGGPENSNLYHLDACSRAARAFIERHREHPFFLYLAYRAPHVPLDAPPEYLKRFPGEMPERRRQALAMIAAIDDGVALIRGTLAKHGLDRRTLIFFVADNGAPLKIHKQDAPGGGPGWNGSLNEPMNGEKGMLTEGGIRVPFLVAWPGRLPAGKVYPHPVSTLDVAATASVLAGLPQTGLDGLNIIPLLRGENKEAAQRTLTWRWVAQSAIRRGPWKLLRGGDREYLFNLTDDPGETRNLLAAQPEAAAHLREELTRWAEELQPPGLQSGNMSETWERSFDFYLDGKPAPPLQDKSVAGSTTSVQRWIPRGCQFEETAEGLRISPQGNKGRAFLAMPGLDLQGPWTARVFLRSERGGRVGLSWRTATQRDFQPDQTVQAEIGPGNDLRETILQLPSDEKTIHLRLLLPAGSSVLGQIEISDPRGRTVARWQFAGDRWRIDDSGAKPPRPLPE